MHPSLQTNDASFGIRHFLLPHDTQTKCTSLCTSRKLDMRMRTWRIMIKTGQYGEYQSYGWNSLFLPFSSVLNAFSTLTLVSQHHVESKNIHPSTARAKVNPKTN